MKSIVPEVIDAEFKQVSPSDREWLVEKVRSSGMGERGLRKIMTEAGHPEFQPGGKYYRRPSIWRRLSWLKYAPAVLIVMFGVWDIASNGAAARWLGRTLFGG